MLAQYPVAFVVERPVSGRSPYCRPTSAFEKSMRMQQCELTARVVVSAGGGGT